MQNLIAVLRRQAQTKIELRNLKSEQARLAPILDKEALADPEEVKRLGKTEAERKAGLEASRMSDAGWANNVARIIALENDLDFLSAEIEIAREQSSIARNESRERQTEALHVVGLALLASAGYHGFVDLAISEGSSGMLDLIAERLWMRIQRDAKSAEGA